MSTEKERASPRSTLEYLAVEPGRMNAPSLRLEAIDILEKCQPDHKIGEEIARLPDVEIFTYACRKYGTSLFRGPGLHTQNDIVTLIQWGDLPPPRRVETFREIFDPFTKRTGLFRKMIEICRRLNDFDLLRAVTKQRPTLIEKVQF